MKNTYRFKNGDIATFHLGSPTVRVIETKEDGYLFKATIIDSLDKSQIGEIKNNFYVHKFFKEEGEF